MNIILTACGTVVTSFLIMLQQRGHYGQPVPAKVHSLFFDCLGPMVCMHPPMLWRNQIASQKTQGMSILVRTVVNTAQVRFYCPKLNVRFNEHKRAHHVVPI